MSWAMFITEEEWTIITLWAAEIFIGLIAWWERNPAYGSVYIWTSVAILINLINNKPENVYLIPNVGAIVGVHSISMIVLTSYLIFEELQPWYEPLSFWNGGLFGLVDWSEML